MAVSYKKLWKLLIDKDMKKEELLQINMNAAEAAFASEETKLWLKNEITKTFAVALCCCHDVFGVADHRLSGERI